MRAHVVAIGNGKAGRDAWPFPAHDLVKIVVQPPRVLRRRVFGLADIDPAAAATVAATAARVHGNCAQSFRHAAHEVLRRTFLDVHRLRVLRNEHDVVVDWWRRVDLDYHRVLASFSKRELLLRDHRVLASFSKDGLRHELLRRDHRVLASFCNHELLRFLVDQRVLASVIDDHDIIGHGSHADAQNPTNASAQLA